jgi:hypothetical protein
LEPAADGKGFVFTFRPGLAFFDDYQRFYARRAGSSVVVDFKDDRETIGEPHRVAHLFAERRTDRQPGGVPYVSTKDVETAKEILSRVPFAQVPDLLDYTFARASRTNFDMQTLGAVKQYLNDYVQARRARTAAKPKAHAVEAAAKSDRGSKDAYNRFCRTETAKLFQSLPLEERHAIEALARSRTPSYASKPGSIIEPFFVLNRDRITVQRHAGRVPSFEEWHAQ